MAVLFDTGLFSVIGLDSELLVGAKLYWYASGTSTPLATYSDDGLTTPNANPVVAGADGRFGPIFLQSAEYKFVLKTSAGVTLVTRDPIDGVDPVTAMVGRLGQSDGSSLVGFLQSGTGATARTVQDKLRDFVGVSDFGGAADGTTDNSAAVTAAQATGRSVIFQAGVHKFNSNVTLHDPIILHGATLKPANGVTITIAGSPIIPLTQVFDTSLGGLIVIDPSSNIWGLPEWWGAVPNTGVDCYAALMACYTASRQVQLQLADYYVAQTVIFDQPFKRIHGRERDYNGAVGQATRLIMLDGVSNVLQIGPTTLPSGGFNAFPQGIVVENIWVTRAAAPTLAGGSIGVTVQYVLRAWLDDVCSDESITGFMVRGVVDTELNACRAFRSISAGSAGTDKWWGFDVDGNLSIGAAGGNASVRLTGCRSAYGGSPPDNSVGLNIHGAFTDTFIREFEDVTDAVGIQVMGLGSSNANVTGNMDVTIQHPVCDQNRIAPIHILDVNPYGSLEIDLPYCGPSTGASAGILIGNCAGVVAIHGGQVPMIGASGSPGISADTCSCLFIDGTIILECNASTGAVVLNNCSGRVEPIVSNYLYGTPAAVLVVGASTTALRVMPTVKGNAGTPHVTYGIQVNAGAANNSEYVVSCIRKTMIAGAKLNIAGVDQTTPGVVPAAGTSIMTGPTT